MPKSKASKSSKSQSNPKKRQKLASDAKQSNTKPRPLGMDLTNDAAKDDEERRLESMLFGVPYTASGGPTMEITVDEDDEEEMEDTPDVQGGRELENMLDSDLFFLDDSAPSSSRPPVFDDAEELAADDETMDAEDAPSQPTPFLSASRKGKKAAAWADPDDTNVEVSLASKNRLRKLRDAPSEDVVGGREYERRLRRQFERINPTPEWASNARRKLQGKRRRGSQSGSEDEEDMLPDLLASTGAIGRTNIKTLSPGTLAVERLRDANDAARAEGEIKSLQFHPSPEVPVLMVASADRRLRLFHVDGATNPLAQTLHIPSLPLTSAVFHPSGSSILMTGPRPFYYTYDLQTGTSHRSPRGLWGTTFTSSTANAQDMSMDTSAFNPTGDILAVAGRRGAVHLVDWRSGSAQVVGSLKANSAIKSLWWARGPAAAGRGELMALGEDSSVYVWDVGQRRCVKRWTDEGGFGSRLMRGDRRGRYLTVGSNTGLVNVYAMDDVLLSGDAKPKPLKTLGNLTTNISTLHFNSDAQLLAMASSTKKDQLRMVHLPSLTAFGNWPTSSTPLGHVTAVDFSIENEYMAVGNNRGRVLLYQLRDYSQI
ncbi:WD40 repeat-like protein [Coniophora puteana RWD-64-598 SS2]|uniref:WD40 repeat-like protein n=1 Tax=Coniophora puteana (strain RWD-64-598) TaxID=741705 RepID=A0A5M3N582_CONPW|nr:WD40 repeat-like protein [Coniophora puteana RWD-64-598 SS2]EIW86071.1 WD40 repeat-like protein [Coniophora puteana RWD-64-598 SS2]